MWWVYFASEVASGAGQILSLGEFMKMTTKEALGGWPPPTYWSSKAFNDHRQILNLSFQRFIFATDWRGRCHWMSVVDVPRKEALSMWGHSTAGSWGPQYWDNGWQRGQWAAARVNRQQHCRWVARGAAYSSCARAAARLVVSIRTSVQQQGWWLVAGPVGSSKAGGWYQDQWTAARLVVSIRTSVQQQGWWLVSGPVGSSRAGGWYQDQ